MASRSSQHASGTDKNKVRDETASSRSQEADPRPREDKDRSQSLDHDTRRREEKDAGRHQEPQTRRRDDKEPQRREDKEATHRKDDKDDHRRAKEKDQDDDHSSDDTQSSVQISELSRQSSDEESESSSDSETPPQPPQQAARRKKRATDMFPDAQGDSDAAPVAPHAELNDVDEWKTYLDTRDKLVHIDDLCWDKEARFGQNRPLKGSLTTYYVQRLLSGGEPLRPVEPLVKLMPGVFCTDPMCCDPSSPFTTLFCL